MDLVEKYLVEGNYTLYWKKKNEKKFKKGVSKKVPLSQSEIDAYQMQIAMDNQMQVGGINIIVVDSSGKVVAHEFNLPGMKHPSYEKELDKVKNIVNKAGFSWK